MVKALLYENELRDQYRKCLRGASEFSLGMALISSSGLKEIADSLISILKSGGQGRVLVGIDLPTDPDAIQILCDWRDEFHGQLELRVFESTGVSIFHPKLSLFKSSKGQWSAIVGSANLTHGGLDENYEASLFVDDRTAVTPLLEFFDENFKGGHSRKIDADWLQRYRVVFRLRQKAMQALKRAREKARRLRAKPPQSKPVPRRVSGHTFAFTGKITDWPRESTLYPYVRSLGGDIADKSGSMGRAHCLVHGNILGGRKTTQKLDAAAEYEIPIITDEEFFRIAKRDERKGSK